MTESRATRDLSGRAKSSFSDDRLPLTKATIATAALNLIDSKGPEGFSMRALAQMLDVKAMSLYHHFKDKEQLLDGVLELIETEVQAEFRRSWSKVGGGPLLRVRRGVDAFRTVWRRHPRAFRIFAQQPARTPERIRGAESFISSLSESGLDREAAIFAYRTILSFVSGFVLLENDNRKPFVTVGSFNREYEVGMEIVLAGIDARLRRSNTEASEKLSSAPRS